MRDDLLIKSNESKYEYIKRIVNGKMNTKTIDEDYTELSELVFGEGNKYNSSEVRKRFYGIKYLINIINNEEIKKLPSNKIEEILDVIGELDIKKMDIREKTNKMNKIKRDLVKNVEIAKYLEEYIEREIQNFSRLDYEKVISVEGKKLIIQVGDWHVGYVITKDYKGNSYNYEIAQRRLGKLLSIIENYVTKYNLTDVIVVQNGDLTEGTYMRKNQSYDCEFDSNEQIVMGEELLYNFINSVSEMNVNVDVYSVGGNHQRGNGDKDFSIEGDNSNFVVVNNLRKFFKLAKNNRVNIHDIDFKDDSATFNVNGLNVKVIHGDNRPNDKKKMFDSESTMDECKYELVLLGHFHNFNISSQNSGGYIITCGSLFGYNPYSVKRMSAKTNASQTLILVGDGEIEHIKDVNLQDII
jgi:hypothetical protein